MKEGFTIHNELYEAVPYGNSGYLVLHNGQQLEKLCRTESSARKYISLRQEASKTCSQTGTQTP